MLRVSVGPRPCCSPMTTEGGTMSVKIEHTRDFLLRVAKLAILMRDVVDGTPSPKYDCEEDPDGYITSLLTALHHWCDEHGLDWEEELHRSRRCHRLDLVEAYDKTLLERQDITSLACPRCQHRGSFLIRVSQNLLMFGDGIELVGDEGEQWDGMSSCTCPSCGYSRIVAHFLPREGSRWAISAT